MSLKGSAFMVMWHDIASEGEPEYHLWHTREHMPERLAIPGFQRGRRGVNWGLQHYRYLTVYEGTDLEVFRSPGYLERLNNPSPWTQRTMPHFRNFLRVSCETVTTGGAGAGGAMGTFRVDFGPGMTEARFRQIAPALADRLAERPGVSAVHTAVARPEVSGVETTENRIRVQMHEKGFEAVILVEAVGLTELEAMLADLTREVAAVGLADVRAEAYDIAFLLGRDGGS
jgi:hypothetical protein